MSRIQKAFQRLNGEGRKALIPFITAGDPDADLTVPLMHALVEAGVPEEKVIGISQGWKLGGAIKTAERKLAEGTLIHGGQPMMAWCCGNAKVEPRGNSILITKQASGSAKIDPLMATFNAVTLLSLNPMPSANIDDFLNRPMSM